MWETPDKDAGFSHTACTQKKRRAINTEQWGFFNFTVRKILFNEQFLVHKLQMKNTVFSMKFLNSQSLDHEGKTLAQQAYTSLEVQTVQEASETCPSNASTFSVFGPWRINSFFKT